MDTEPSSTQSIKKPVTPDLTTVEMTQDITLTPLTANRHEALHQMQGRDPFCKCISKGYQKASHHYMRLIYLHTLNDYNTNMS